MILITAVSCHLYNHLHMLLHFIFMQSRYGVFKHGIVFPVTTILSGCFRNCTWRWW